MKLSNDGFDDSLITETGISLCDSTSYNFEIISNEFTSCFRLQQILVTTSNTNEQQRKAVQSETHHDDDDDDTTSQIHARRCLSQSYIIARK